MDKFVKIIITVIIFIAIILGIILVSNKSKQTDTINNSNKEPINDISKDNNDNKKANEITFGKYYNDTNELEDIEWIILEENEESMLLITKYAINSVPYNNSLKETTWDNSDIRTWLNEEFYNMAFTDAEKNAIISTNNKAQINPNHKDTPIGKDTKDNVFLLSYDEIVYYFPNKENRLLTPTNYAIMQGCYTNSDGNVAWWTRSVGISETSPEYLASAGDFGNREHQVNENIIGTRPAVWIKK